MRFESPWLLLLLILIPIFFRIWRERGRPARISFSVPIPKTKALRANPVRFLLWTRILGLIFLIIALARPQFGVERNERKVEGIDIVLVMDVSASMNIEDLAERPRLEVAKDTIKQFVEGRSNDRIGFVVFSGEPVTLAPPTLDYGLLTQAIGAAKVGELRDGTAIGDGLAAGINRLRDSRAKSRVIVLLTDGENNVGELDPATAGDLAAGYGIRVYTIAIGREGRVRLPIRRKNPFGKTVTTYQWFENQLNPKLLKQIAKVTQGKFYRVTDEEALRKVFGDIDQLEKTEIKSPEKKNYKDAFGLPLRLGMLFLVLEQILALAWWRLFL